MSSPLIGYNLLTMFVYQECKLYEDRDFYGFCPRLGSHGMGWNDAL
jgi:hypothetical protein